ncbi:putative transposase [Rhizobium sp. BK226]|uniref:Mu transposase C-terminal domain-containing protein n=1 Tax=Rhizobium sp. BK226 TaxID=2587075 RepID=UPI00160C5039|nr:Mu transposase C-terminal domain-containing protein [Rhizobium sp. BK226]MBB4113205.1 putative transposase [Rhizobium sp. BK226]
MPDPRRNPSARPSRHQARGCPLRRLQPQRSLKGNSMETNLPALLSLQHGAVLPVFNRLPVKARVRDRGIDYCVLYCDRNGAALQRMDETQATVTFSQAELTEALNRPGNPMTVEKDFYAETKARARLKGADKLSGLNPSDQETVLKREYFVRSFYEMRADYREKCRLARIDGMPLPPRVSKSRDSLLRVIPLISLKWRAQQLASSPKATYRTKEKTVTLVEPTPSTLKTWMQKMEENDFDPVFLRNQYRDERQEYFTADELIHLNAAIAAACSRTDPDLARIHADMVTVMEAENKIRGADDQLRIPCESTLRNRYAELPEMKRDLAHDGKDAAKRKWQPEHGGIDVIRAGERMEVDDHETDLHTILAKMGVWKTMSKADRAKVKRIRLWISAGVDVASRSLAALYVSSRPPSMKSAMAVLEMATREKTDIARRLGCSTAWVQGGTMETIAVDSAAYFAHRPFRIAVNDMGSDLFLPPAGEAPWRGFIERWFGTFGHQMFNYFNGRTWSSSSEKGDYDSEAEADMIADQVAECMLRWAVDGYHNAPHSELNGATPLNRWLELSRDYGVMPGPTGAIRTHLFGTYIKRTISKKGLRAAGLYFQSKQLQKIRRKVGKTPVVARINNHNLGSASVWAEDGWIEVPCVHKELEGVSIWQWLAATEKLRLFNTENAKVSRGTLQATFLWLKNQAEMARLESGLLSPVLAEEDYQRFEQSMDRTFDVVEKPFEGEFVPDGEWHPSNELFAALAIQPVIYAKAKKSAKAVREEANTGSRPEIGTMPKVQAEASAAEPLERVDNETTVVRRITSNIFDN